MNQDSFGGGDRERLQALEEEVRALRQLATLGRLASGVAHDFNNQLTSILGYADLLLSTSSPGDVAHEDLLEIRRAAERATVITQQILAFARPHAPQPGFVNLADIVTDTVRLLRRVFGPEIHLTTSLPSDAVVVQADPAHIGHALLHLAVHARDALPQGGTLTFELSDAAQLNVRAAGETSAIISNAAPDALDTVVHIVEQNGGRFQIARESGTFDATLTFPVATADPQTVALRSAPPRGHETILVVDDDGAVRTLMRTLLERHGYRVIVAEGPQDALAIARAAAPAIDLLVADLVLPEMWGDAMAGQIQQLRTGLRVLYVSGHADALATDRPPLTPAGTLLAKPFTPNRLLLAVRQALDTR